MFQHACFDLIWTSTTVFQHADSSIDCFPISDIFVDCFPTQSLTCGFESLMSLSTNLHVLQLGSNEQEQKQETKLGQARRSPKLTEN